jgi:hypothetical protein
MLAFDVARFLGLFVFLGGLLGMWVAIIWYITRLPEPQPWVDSWDCPDEVEPHEWTVDENPRFFTYGSSTYLVGENGVELVSGDD